MNGLIKQLITSNCPVAQLAEHKNGLGSNPRGFAKKLSQFSQNESMPLPHGARCQYKCSLIINLQGVM